MFNFIICDNDSFLLEKLKDFIENNVMYESIRTFTEYTNSFFKVVNDKTIKNKFYILDIETVSQNGIIVAGKIRNVDINSIIVFLTGHEDKYVYKIAKSRFRYDALINKFDNFENELIEVVKAHSKYIDFSRRILVNVNSNTSVLIELNNLFYVKTNKSTQKVIFQTKNNIVETYESLIKFEEQLNSDFIKINRSCFINKNYAIFDFENNIISFENGVELKNIMSQNFIKTHNIHNSENNNNVMNNERSKNNFDTKIGDKYKRADFREQKI